ncbi:MAG: excinuclease ABC subunit UvrA [Burkholderiaceae bacterium]|jgi:excinuclease ABC subunit A|nr:excinuclease ABC subunit UvrA [Burkholderiaceae bacterium]
MTHSRLIRIRGARTHNLKGIDLDIPRDAFVVITGVSGSGKSSLAFDTLYAEGQRRYVESLSPYARQFLHLMERPDVDLIEGLSPAIAIEQKANNHNPRSTVGTVTEIADYLRLLFARAGTPHCPEHPARRLASQTLSQLVDQLMAAPPETKATLLAPIVREQLGDLHPVIDGLRAQGFARVQVQAGSGPIEDHPIDALPPQPRDQPLSLWVVIDRLKIKGAIRERLGESLEMAMRLGHDQAIVVLEPPMQAAPQRLRLSPHLACPDCGHTPSNLEPSLFSFNSPAGACPQCDGLGEETRFDVDRIVQFPHLSLASGAITGWDQRNTFAWSILESLSEQEGFALDEPFDHLSRQTQDLLLFGSAGRPISLRYELDRGRSVVRHEAFEGILPNLERRWAQTDNTTVREELGKLRKTQTCSGCGGSRLCPQARSVRVGEPGHDTDLPSLLAMPLQVAHQTLSGLQFKGAHGPVGERLLGEIQARLSFLIDVGLSYLSLDRGAATLSGGESQRIRLASQIGAGLSGVLYVLDEPSIGLHQRDNERLLSTLKKLQALGNSVVVVEHDEDAIRAADMVIDMGPGAGSHGGEVVAQGSPADIMATAGSLTGDYLSGRRGIALPAHRRPRGERSIQIRGARGHNLQNLDIDIPIGLMVSITGVSGSGKSTLINETLAVAAARQLNGARAQPAAVDAINGLEHFERLVCVDQSPIGRTPRSNPATYTGLFTPIRDLFAGSTTARERGYDSGRFSFNVKGGRCEACQGDGLVKVEMHFLPDLFVPCDVCGGARYNRETLDVRYRGKTIAEVLGLTISEAQQFFAAIPAVSRRLDTLSEVGLGYLRLGQSATSLSGGEAQRVKLACELSKRESGKTLYLLDEPTTGLHFHDIALLLTLLGQLRDAGNTVVIIEHNLDVIKVCDWVIDLGPDGGMEGGRVITQGTPEMVAADPVSKTGHHLGRLLPLVHQSAA